MKEQNLEILRASITDLETQTTHLEAELAEITSKLKNDPNTTVQQHIRLLHEYNEIKDVGQGLMGMIADARGVRVVDVHREFGVGEKD
ncbi:hypothetical protein N7510_006857 [Penicillium lagena]|uniref:uncharacterized protein n=1 Tax=Penicillium lagena TaxID=94218 RepID=UPI002541E9C2|nr:uncharacterized protein N7510_006857 [Penicillium lagena]KAJ5610138.1 hypothetical protein N7510_006857 [Penicillium lagena]